jgi:hypothetical protein
MGEIKKVKKKRPTVAEQIAKARVEPEPKSLHLPKKKGLLSKLRRKR